MQISYPIDTSPNALATLPGKSSTKQTTFNEWRTKIDEVNQQLLFAPPPTTTTTHLLAYITLPICPFLLLLLLLLHLPHLIRRRPTPTPPVRTQKH